MSQQETERQPEAENFAVKYRQLEGTNSDMYHVWEGTAESDTDDARIKSDSAVDLDSMV